MEIIETQTVDATAEMMKPGKRVRTKKSDKNYVNNEELTKAVKEWVKDKKTQKVGPMPNFVGECVMKLVNNFAHKRNFSGYSYLDDMKSEALLTCIKYAHNFNPEKSDNAFAYFTEIIKNSFKMSLNKEKYQQNIREKIVSENTDTSKYNYNNIDLDHGE
jgi:DNA-directed RNA polymerase specialized sigma subunit